MPSRSYRKKIRTVGTGTLYISPSYDLIPYMTDYYNYDRYKQNNVQATDYAIVPNYERTNLENAIYETLDMITKQSKLTDILAVLTSIKEVTGPRSEYCKKLDTILESMCGIIGNITDSVGGDIIKMRIDYIRSLIAELPESCDDYTPLSEMIIGLITLITSSFDINSVTANVHDIHNFVDTNFSLAEIYNVRLIQETLIDIICNIKQGNNTAIIADRIEYVRTKLLPLIKR